VWLTVAQGLLIPFFGTVLGSACVFFMKKELSRGVQRALTGFAGGVMVAASIWSLLIPAMEQSAGKGKCSLLSCTPKLMNNTICSSIPKDFIASAIKNCFAGVCRALLPIVLCSQKY